MATKTFIFKSVEKFLSANPGSWKNHGNITDDDLSSYGSFEQKAKGITDLVIRNPYNISSIPVGSIINSVKIKTYAGTDADMHIRYIVTNKDVNGVSENKGTLDYDTDWISPSSLKEVVMSDKSRIGTWTRDELTGANGSGSGYSGITVVLRAYNSATLLTRSFHPRYFMLEVDYTVPTFTITVNSSGNGSVTGGGTYEYGKSVTLTATPNAGYRFVKWSDGSTANPRAITVSAAATYTAQFEADKLNDIFCGTVNIQAVYRGTTPLRYVYIGTNKIYG